MSNARKLADNLPTEGQLGNRNLFINGAMQVAQRASSATAAVAGGSYITLDRYKIFEDTDGAYTSEQSTTAPDGFPNSMKLQVTTADTSLSSAQYAALGQFIEAQNLQHLDYGTNAAKDVTVSFYVRSNKTGTYCFCLEKNDSTRYLFIKEFTIDAADTWERKIITVPPDSQIKASGGAIDNNNGAGLRAFIFLAAGSDYHGTNNVWNSNTSYYATSNQVNWMDSTSNNFYVTGMQLEVGTEATPFEHPRSFGDELARCQRYFIRYDGNTEFVCQFYSATNGDFNISTPVTMRATPSLTCTDRENTANKISLYSSGYTHGHNISIITSRSIGNIMTLRIAGVSSGVVGVNEAVQVQFYDLRLDAEL